MVRLTFLLSNGVFIVSERGTDPALEESLKEYVVFTPHNETKVWRCIIVSCVNVVLNL